MPQLNKLLMVSVVLLFVGCSSIQLVRQQETTETPATADSQRSEPQGKKISVRPTGHKPYCSECYIVPQSGLNKDLRYGYYYDQEERKCKRITYSSGSGCIPAPFETLQECLDCCGQ